MEQRFIQNICKKAPVIKFGSNGDDVAISKLAEFMDSKLRILAGRYYPVIIFFDRERRIQSSEDICRELHKTLMKMGHDIPIYIGVADRTIENWILADRESFAQKYKTDLDGRCFEGDFGKSKIKNALGGKYHETTDGVTMLKSCIPSVIAKNSPSFKALFDKIDINCWWLQK